MIENPVKKIIKNTAVKFNNRNNKNLKNDFRG